VIRTICGMGVSPMKHGQDARATPPRGMGVPPMKHGQDARATPGCGVRSLFA
jgi:hypothetical protein